MIAQMLMTLAIAFGLIVPTSVIPTSIVATEVSEDQEWAEFHAESYAEHADAFTALFNSYEVKRTKNNRLMIRQGDSGSFKFIAKPRTELTLAQKRRAALESFAGKGK